MVSIGSNLGLGRKQQVRPSVKGAQNTSHPNLTKGPQEKNNSPRRGPIQRGASPSKPTETANTSKTPPDCAGPRGIPPNPGTPRRIPPSPAGPRQTPPHPVVSRRIPPSSVGPRQIPPENTVFNERSHVLIVVCFSL